jgi:hypothetical protein
VDTQSRRKQEAGLATYIHPQAAASSANQCLLATILTAPFFFHLSLLADLFFLSRFLYLLSPELEFQFLGLEICLFLKDFAFSFFFFLLTRLVRIKKLALGSEANTRCPLCEAKNTSKHFRRLREQNGKLFGHELCADDHINPPIELLAHIYISSIRNGRSPEVEDYVHRSVFCASSRSACQDP